MEIFTVKYLLYPKLTFSEKGSTLNIDEVETSCVCQRNLVGLIDLWGNYLWAQTAVFSISIQTIL